MADAHYLMGLCLTVFSLFVLWVWTGPVGVIVAAAPLPAAFMGPIWGSLGDRIGRKPMMVRANLAIAVFVGCMGLVGGPWQLVALRLGQGVFIAGPILHPGQDVVRCAVHDAQHRAHPIASQ